ncbi:MAG: hypothetical protein ACRDLM_04885 [Gaiellaceae bacterium]
MTRLRWLGVAVCGVLLLAGPATAGKHQKHHGIKTRFVNYGLAQTPGVSCPGSSKCSNIAAEPAIRADATGLFYASSENSLGNGTEAWRSADNGRHYAALDSPNQVSSSNTSGFAPGGGDTDLAVATAKNSSHSYNVYVASLYLASVGVATSADRGKTWSFNPVGADVGGADDREWIAADGASKVCVSYHDGEQNIDVNCSTDAGGTFTQLASAIDTSHAFQIGNNEIGNLAIDPKTHDIFQTYSSITTAQETACAPQLGVSAGTCGYHGVYMAVSTDGGSSFTDYPVYVNKKATVDYGHQFVNVSVDSAGNVYSVYTDDHHVYYSFSTDHGKKWSGPYLITTTSGTQIFPWSTAGDAGKLDVVYYQTSFYDSKQVPDTYPNKATWTVGLAQNLHALKPGSKWNRFTASPVIHKGGVCESGVTCTGNRDLFDDFGVAASPVTGLASIVYSDDQWAKNGQTNPNCTAQSGSNSSTCDHTAIATQISGRRIFAK